MARRRDDHQDPEDYPARREDRAAGDRLVEAVAGEDSVGDELDRAERGEERLRGERAVTTSSLSDDIQDIPALA